MAVEPDRSPVTFASYLQLTQWHIELRPMMLFQDVYKLVFQSVLGAGHIAPNPEAIARMLAKELATLNPDAPTDPLTEPIHPAGRTLRVNLRPFLAKGMDVDKLSNLFHASTRAGSGTKGQLAAIWSQIQQHPVITDLIKQPKEEIHAFSQKVVDRDFPLMHHSSLYKKHYAPAYRVVDHSLLTQTFKTTLEAK